MKSERLLLTQNYLEIEQANKLGIPPPDPNHTLSQFLFRAQDVKRAVVDGESVLLDFYDGESFSIGFDQKLWDKLELNFDEEDKL